MADDLRLAHRQLRQLRARLPELIQVIANSQDNENSLGLFHTVARDAAAWHTEAKALAARFAELEPLLARIEDEVPEPEFSPANQSLSHSLPLSQPHTERDHNSVGSTSLPPPASAQLQQVSSASQEPEGTQMRDHLSYGLDLDDFGMNDVDDKYLSLS